MTRALLLLLAVVPGCASLPGCALLNPPPEPPALCVTRCGLRLVNSFNPTLVPTCEELQVVEDEALKVFTSAKVVALDPRFADACRTLSFFELKVGPEDLWHAFKMNTDGGHTIVAGYTECGGGIRPVIVYSWRSSLAATALAHEMAHAAQGCKPLPPFSERDPDHSNWEYLYDAGVQ